MENKNKLCLYVSYYLSRFNTTGYQNLGYSHMNQAHQDIGALLDVKPNTVKNMRDEFDPLHGFRAGWYQSPLSISRVRVVEALQGLDEFQIRSIVQRILANPLSSSEDIASLLDVVLDEQDAQKAPRAAGFILRGPTGKKAEEYFITHYSMFSLPVAGRLHDARDLGTGYDFRIETAQGDHFVEVKGLAQTMGGVLFTGKEWEMARKYPENYHLVVVSGLDEEPELSIIANPAAKLAPRVQIRKTIQVNFSVSPSQLKGHLNQ